MNKSYFVLFGLIFVLSSVQLSNGENVLHLNETSTDRPSNNSTIDSCQSNAICNGHGFCVNMTDCRCDYGWKTVKSLNGTTGNCAYEQKSKTRAVFMSLFFGFFGGDWFYLSRQNSIFVAVGFVKLFLSLGLVATLLVIYFFAESEWIGNFRGPLQILKMFLTFIIILWLITDIARIGSNRFYDGNRVSLA